MGRALIYSNPEVIRLLTEKTVPYAGDQWYLHRQKDAEGEFFWKVAQQGHNRNLPMDATRQGHYLATPDGRLLASDPFRPSVGRFLEMVKSGLAKWEQEGRKSGDTALAGASDRRYSRAVPEDGMVLKVYSRIPLPRDGENWNPNNAVGRDHVWLRREEWQSLQPDRWENGHRYPLPAAVAERLARFHLTDNVRGEPPMWTRQDIREARLMLRVVDSAAGKVALEGPVMLRSQDGQRGYEARLQGALTFDRQARKVTRFDVLAWGESWGEGPFTRGAPPGRFPLLISFSLAGNQPSDLVPPQAARDLGEYFATGR